MVHSGCAGITIRGKRNYIVNKKKGESQGENASDTEVGKSLTADDLAAEEKYEKEINRHGDKVNARVNYHGAYT